MGAVCISIEFMKSIALLPFFKFLGKWWNKLYKKYTVFNSLVHVTSVSCADCPRSVLLWLVAQYCMILGDRSKNSLIALCDRSPNSRKKHGQTKSTKNVQFSKITHLLCCFPCRVSVWFYLIFLGNKLYIFWAFYTSDNSHYVKWVLI